MDPRKCLHQSYRPVERGGGCKTQDTREIRINLEEGGAGWGMSISLKMVPRTPLMNFPDDSPLKVFASSMASLIATFEGRLCRFVDPEAKDAASMGGDFSSVAIGGVLRNEVVEFEGFSTPSRSSSIKVRSLNSGANLQDCVQHTP